MKSIEPIRRSFSVEGKPVYTFSKISNNKNHPKKNKIHKKMKQKVPKKYHSNVLV